MPGRRAEMELLKALYRAKSGGFLLRGIDTGGLVKGHGVQAGCNTAIKRADGWCLWCLKMGSTMRVMPDGVVRRLESAGCRLVASLCGSEMKLVLQ